MYLMLLRVQELWRLDLGSWEWDQLPLKGSPSARSGHRMVAHKGRIILFGGYYDTGREMRCGEGGGRRGGRVLLMG